jgi:hypothetical protein
LELGKLVLQMETLPALSRKQPFTDLHLAQAVGLARFLADYDEARIRRCFAFVCGRWCDERHECRPLRGEAGQTKMGWG